MKIRAIAKVQVTVEVQSAAWGGDCSIQQLYDQAAEDALQKVTGAISKTGFHIVGKPNVVGVITHADQ